MVVDSALANFKFLFLLPVPLAANSGTNNRCHPSRIAVSSNWSSIWSQSPYITSCSCQKTITVRVCSSWYISTQTSSKGRRCEHSVW